MKDVYSDVEATDDDDEEELEEEKEYNEAFEDQKDENEEKLEESEESEEERAQREANQHLHEQTPKAAQEIIRTLQRKIFYLSTFLAEQGLSSEAEDYLSDHMDTPALFEDEW